MSSYRKGETRPEALHRAGLVSGKGRIGSVQPTGFTAVLLPARDRAWSWSASGQPVACGFLTLCRKDFTTLIQVILRVCLLKLGRVKQRKGCDSRNNRMWVCSGSL